MQDVTVFALPPNPSMIAMGKQTDANFAEHEGKIAELKQDVAELKRVINHHSTRIGDALGDTYGPGDVYVRLAALEAAKPGVAPEALASIGYPIVDVAAIRASERQRAAGIVEELFPYTHGQDMPHAPAYKAIQRILDGANHIVDANEKVETGPQPGPTPDRTALDAKTEPVFTQADLDAAVAEARKDQCRKDFNIRVGAVNQAIQATRENDVAWVRNLHKSYFITTEDLERAVHHILAGDEAPKQGGKDA